MRAAPPPRTLAPGDDRADGPSGAYSALTAWAALAFAVLLGFSRLSYGLLLPALRAELTGSYRVLGLVGSANLAGYLVGTLLSPTIVGRARDRRRLNAAALGATGLTMLGSATSANLAQLGGWRFAVGACSAVATVLTIALTLERVAPAARGRASGVIWTGGAIGVAATGLLAPPLLGSGAAGVWRAAWVAMGAVGLLAAWGLARAHRLMPVPGTTGPGATAPVSGGAGEVLRLILHPARLLSFTLAYGLFGGGYIIYFTFFVALTVARGFPPAQTGLIWAILGATGAIGGLGWGRAIDRWPSGFVFAVALALGAIGGLAVLAPAPWVATLGVPLMGTAFVGAPALMTALLRRAVPAARYPASFSLVTAIFATAQTIAPPLGGLVADRAGLAAATALSGLVLAGAAILAACYGVVQRRTVVSRES